MMYKILLLEVYLRYDPVCPSVDRSSVCHNFFREITVPCTYRSTCFHKIENPLIYKAMIDIYSTWMSFIPLLPEIIVEV